LVLSDRRSEAYDALADLASLLRLSLERSQAQVISFHDELEFTRLYLDVMSRRFPDQLRVTWEIEPETINAEVPSLILQPLVENAIKHGSAASGGYVSVEISAHCERDVLVIQIGNDRDTVRTGDSHSGFGIVHLRERLAHLYGARAEVLIDDHDPENFSITLKWPYRRLAVGSSSYELASK
jgi:sensor histidine kinase YesM